MYRINPAAYEKLADRVQKLVKECDSVFGRYLGNEIDIILLNVEKDELRPGPDDTVHELKIHPQFFKDMVSGAKNNEIRQADRPFEVGDWLKLMEWNPQSKEYTGAFVFKKITYITKAVFGLDKQWILSLQ